MQDILSYGVFASVIIFTILRLSLYCQFFQQEEYTARRFFDVILNGFHLVDKKLTLVLLIGLGVFAFWDNDIARGIFMMVAFLGFAALHLKYFKQAKKPLVYTSRVKRILTAANIIALIAYCYVWMLPEGVFELLGHMAFIQMIPLFLVAGNWALIPYEKYNQKKFYNEAVATLKKLNPMVIGITGSYGKTSVKHILNHVLNQAVPTLATPGSVNTVMGIARIIRERLTPHHKVFIAEMGAYGVGSIKRLCDFCPPDHGILTAVGVAHYERFKSVDQVAKAKFELFEAVAARGGNFVINTDQVDGDYIKRYAPSYEQGLILTSSNPDYDGAWFKVLSSETTAEGAFIRLQIGTDVYDITAPLYGQHQTMNIVAAIALALSIGMPIETIVAALKTTPQITHRLEVKHFVDGPSVIDDAYNSNPSGFEDALNVLSVLAKAKGGRAILVTPGMVELGALHDKEHARLGKKAAEICDEIVLIGAGRIPTFAQAVKDSGKMYHYFDSFAQAKAWLNQESKIKDVILYENDLPDLYENSVRL